MSFDLTFDQFLSKKGDGGFTVFVFFLGDEYQHLSHEDSWLQHFEYPIFIVRLSEDDFDSLDIGVHPKVLIFRDGREVAEFDGLPKMTDIKAKVRRMIYGSTSRNQG